MVEGLLNRKKVESLNRLKKLAATDAGAAAAAQVGTVVSVQVIPRPHDGLSGLGKWLE